MKILCMNSTFLIARVTALCIVLELVLGGHLAFGFIIPESHIIMGGTVLVLAVITLTSVQNSLSAPRMCQRSLTSDLGMES